MQNMGVKTLASRVRRYFGVSSHQTFIVWLSNLSYNHRRRKNN